MVFGNINGNSCYSILKVLCFRFRSIKATIIRSIRVYNWLTTSEFSSLSENELLIPEWLFSVRSSGEGVYIHCKGNLTNWGLFKKCFLEGTGFIQQICSKSLLESQLSWTPQGYKQTCQFFSCDNHPWEQNDERKRTINKSNCNIEIFPSLVKIRSRSNQS